MAEFGAAGTRRVDATSAAATRPSASGSSTRSTPSTGVASSTRASASETEITGER